MDPIKSKSKLHHKLLYLTLLLPYCYITDIGLHHKMCRFEICHYSYWAPYSEQTTATRINSWFITYFNQVNNDI